MTFIQRAAGTLNLFQDIGSAGRPDEGFRAFIVAVDVTADCQDEFFLESAPANCPLCI
jgi:hypothetical protein